MAKSFLYNQIKQDIIHKIDADIYKNGDKLPSEAQLVEVNDQIQKAKAELVSEQSQYTYYNSVLNSKTNITSVEEVAGRLGLMKMDQSQLTYIRLDSDSVLVRRESAVHQWTDFLHDGAMTILASVRSVK